MARAIPMVWEERPGWRSMVTMLDFVTGVPLPQFWAQLAAL
jgi:hypothetical protein